MLVIVYLTTVIVAVNKMSEEHSPGPAGDGAPRGEESSSSQPSSFQSVINFLGRDKIESAMWVTRLITIFFTISFVLPFFG